MSGVTKQPDFAKLGFRPTGLPHVAGVKRPLVIYLRPPKGVQSLALTEDGQFMFKWGRDTVLHSRYGYKIIEPRSFRWQIWFRWRRWRRQIGL